MSNLYEKLEKYSKSDYIPLHMPGHKRNYEKFGIDQTAGIDITEIDGFDDYHYPQTIIKEITDQAAEIYGVSASFYLVNGSTSGLLTAISAVTNYGDRIVVARNCHKAVYNGVFIRGLVPEYIYPQMCGDSGILGIVTPEDVLEALQRTKAFAVVITSPTYEGVVSDVGAIAKICHENGAVLIVDEAHGAHFNFDKEFPKTAMESGADIVIESLHKTLPCYTQTAIMHICSDRIDIENIRRFLSIYQTSSPSYIFMSQINRCIDYMVSQEGRTENKQYIKNLKKLRQKLAELKNIKLFEPKQKSECFDYDISKLVLCVPGKGVALYETLLEKYHIQAEMAAADYVICMTSIGDDYSWYESLIKALGEIDKSIGTDQLTGDKYEMVSAQVMLPPAKAIESIGKEYDLSQSCGKIAMECMYAYPPGIPLIYPGELISEELLEKINSMRCAGVTIKGLKDHKGDKILCIK